MGTTADKLNKLLQTKREIKQAIIDKGVDISNTDTFASYPEKIRVIQTGSANSREWLDILTDGGTRGEYLFYSCNSLTEVNLSGLNTSAMTNISYMFNGCAALQTLDLSNFDTRKVTNMSYMFSGCIGLTYVNVSSLNTSAATTLTNMFTRCSALKSIDVTHFDLSKVTSIGSIFEYCSSLTSLDCSTWDISNITSSYGISGAFNNCTALIDFYPPQNINANMSVNKSNALSHDSLLRILNNLMTITTTKTLTLGATNLAKLTDEEKAIATNKGWTLA